MSTQQSISLGSESAAPELNTRPLLDHLIALVDSVEAAGQHFTSLGFTVVVRLSRVFVERRADAPA